MRKIPFGGLQPEPVKHLAWVATPVVLQCAKSPSGDCNCLVVFHGVQSRQMVRCNAQNPLRGIATRVVGQAAGSPAACRTLQCAKSPSGDCNFPASRKSGFPIMSRSSCNAQNPLRGITAHPHVRSNETCRFASWGRKTLFPFARVQRVLRAQVPLRPIPRARQLAPPPRA